MIEEQYYFKIHEQIISKEQTRQKSSAIVKKILKRFQNNINKCVLFGMDQQRFHTAKTTTTVMERSQGAILS